MKQIFYIFILVVFFATASKAQYKPITTIEPTTKYVNFYPNPAITNITFELQQYDQSYTLQIFNFIGKKMIDIRADAPVINLSLTDFYRGLYIFQLRDRTGRTLDSGKFQVIR